MIDFDVRIDGRVRTADRAGHLRHRRLHPGADLSPRHVRRHQPVEHRRVRFVDPSRRRRRRRVSSGRRRRRSRPTASASCRIATSSSTVARDLVDQSLAFVYGLLALSIVIAVFGIVLTLLLAVYERRRETGLLRAVGMTRAQVRTTVRWESVLTSVYGAVVGVVHGSGARLRRHRRAARPGPDEYFVPVPARIVAILVIAFVVGVVAAVDPGVAGDETRHPAGDRHRMTAVDLSAGDVGVPHRASSGNADDVARRRFAARRCPSGSATTLGAWSSSRVITVRRLGQGSQRAAGRSTPRSARSTVRAGQRSRAWLRLADDARAGARRRGCAATRRAYRQPGERA